MRRLRVLRIALAAFCFLGVTAAFVDPTGTCGEWFAWLAKLQLVPALLAGSFVVAALVVLSAVLVGRAYCSVVCPLGVLQDMAIFLRRKIWKAGFRVGNKSGISSAALFLRLAFLGIFLGGGVLGLHFAWLDPYAIYGRLVTVAAVAVPAAGLMAVSLGLVLLIFALAVWKGRFWCNTVCPVGTVLGLIARGAVLRPKIDAEKCVKCGMCARACKAGSIDVESGKVDMTKCVACCDCGAVCRKGALEWSK